MARCYWDGGNGMMSREDIDVVTVLLSEHLPVNTPRGHSIARVMAHLYEARQALPGPCSQCSPGHDRGDGRCGRHGKLIG